MSKPKIRIGVCHYPKAYDELVTWVQAAEEAGAEYIGLGDGQDVWRELYVALTVAAVHTKRALIGPLVTNPVTRHPAVAASAIATINEVSGGRALFGLGRGISAIRNIGESRSSLDTMISYARAVKGLCAGETVEYEGKPLKLNWPTSAVPVSVVAEGPRGQQLAGQYADGVILNNGASAEFVRNTVKEVRAAAEAAGRDFDKFENWSMVRVVISKTEEEGIDIMRDYLSSFAAVSGSRPAGITDTTPDIQEKIDAIKREYRFTEHHHHKVGLSFNGSLVEKYGIKKWLADRFMIAGPPEKIIDGFYELAEAGISNFIVAQLFADPVASTREFGDKVIAKL
jgi:5,10-methylenetetrahydromethanopterin reductase